MKELSAEERIKEAARIVFTKKGYAATKTRDIAEQAGLNLALLNYYFRSKEKLFEIIMREKVQQLFTFISPVITDTTTSLEEKMESLIGKYIDMLLKDPGLPLFVLGEIQNNPEKFGKSVQLDTMVMKSDFMRQLVEKKPDVNPFQILVTLLGMLVFPFITKPVFKATGVLTEKTFTQLMEERKKLALQWMTLILES